MGIARTVWHPDIALALSGLAPRQAEAAGGALTELLSDTRRSRRSTLTGDGFPLICAFTTADDTLRWTADLRPSATTSVRSAATIEAFRALTGEGAALPPAASKFGAWLGGRVSQVGACSYKLYLDPAADFDSDDLPLPAHSLGGFRHKLRMIGIGPDPDQREYYYRFENSSPYLLHCLLDVAGLRHRHAEVLEVLRARVRRPIRDRLPGGAIGASFARSGPGAPLVPTLYFFARSIWGTDARVRSGFLDLLAEAGHDLAPYAAASAPLRTHVGFRNYHDMLALSLTETGHAWGLGLRPVSEPRPTAS